MSEYQITDLYIGLMTNNGIFVAVNIFLLWMMFRGVNVARENGSNLFQKILSTLACGCVLIFNLGTWGNMSSTINNWAYSLSQLEERSGASQAFVDRMGVTGYTDPSLIPSDPVTIVFWAVIAISLFMGIWTTSESQES